MFEPSACGARQRRNEMTVARRAKAISLSNPSLTTIRSAGFFQSCRGSVVSLKNQLDSTLYIPYFSVKYQRLIIFMLQEKNSILRRCVRRCWVALFYLIGCWCALISFESAIPIELGQHTENSLCLYFLLTR